MLHKVSCPQVGDQPYHLRFNTCRGFLDQVSKAAPYYMQSVSFYLFLVNGEFAGAPFTHQAQEPGEF